MGKKQAAIGAIVFLFVFTMAPILVSAKESKKEADALEAKRTELRKKVEEKKAEINGSSWDIQINSSNPKAGLTGPDQLTFQDGKFTSRTFSKKGYSATNYTLTVQEETGATTWETMQTSEKDGIAFWRGEWKDDVMSGVINRQLEEGNEEYYFSSSAMKRIPPTSEKTEAESETSSGEAAPASESEKVLVSATQPTEATPPAETQKAQEKPRKSSWFF